MPRKNTSGVRYISWCKTTKKWLVVWKPAGQTRKFVGRYELFSEAERVLKLVEAGFSVEEIANDEGMMNE